MSGPVWRCESGVGGVCDVCLRHADRLYVEGSVGNNALHPARRVCESCYAQHRELILAGETGARSISPAYVGLR